MGIPTVNEQRRNDGQVAKRVEAYLRILGARDEDYRLEWIRTQMQSIVEDGTEEKTSGTTLADVKARMDQWLDYLAAEYAPDSATGRGLLAWLTRKELENDPRALLKREQLPESLTDAVAGAPKEVLPPSKPREMPPQEIGELPDALRMSFWLRLWHTVVAAR